MGAGSSVLVCLGCAHGSCVVPLDAFGTYCCHFRVVWHHRLPMPGHGLERLRSRMASVLVGTFWFGTVELLHGPSALCRANDNEASLNCWVSFSAGAVKCFNRTCTAHRYNISPWRLLNARSLPQNTRRSTRTASQRHVRPVSLQTAARRSPPVDLLLLITGRPISSRAERRAGFGCGQSAAPGVSRLSFSFTCARLLLSCPDGPQACNADRCWAQSQSPDP